MFDAARVESRTLLLVVAAVVLLLCARPLRAQESLVSPWLKYTQEDGLASNNVLVVAVGDDEVWFGADSGISRYDGAWRSWSGDADLGSGVLSLAVGDSGKELWAGTVTGAVMSWDGAAWEMLTALDSPVQALHYAEGNLWIGTTSGLYVWGSGSPASVAGFDDAFVNVIESSEDGNTIWVGTSHRLWLRQSGRWRAIDEADGLPAGEVTALWAAADGPVWAAVDGNIAWRHPATGAWQQVDTAPLHTRARVRITSLTGTGSGSIWGSTEGSGFFRLIARTVNGTLTPRYDLNPQSINHGETSFIHSLAIDAAGTLWMGTVSGVFRSDRKMWGRELRAPAGGPINEIQAMLADDEGNLWIGTRGAAFV